MLATCDCLKLPKDTGIMYLSQIGNFIQSIKLVVHIILSSETMPLLREEDEEKTHEFDDLGKLLDKKRNLT